MSNLKKMSGCLSKQNNIYIQMKIAGYVTWDFVFKTYVTLKKYYAKLTGFDLKYNTL